MAERGPLAAEYDQKPATYYSGPRNDFLAVLPENPNAEILEIGCGDGSMGALALAQKKCGRYVGIELFKPAAEIARSKLTSVLVGDVETLDFPWAEQTFDALIMSEVLEHLIDPWRLLRRLYPLLKNGALVLASSPNVSQHRVIKSLLLGGWELTDSGVMDRTHLRWFTPQSYRDMFDQSGFDVIDVSPVVPFGMRVRLLNRLTGRYFEHLFIRQINLKGKKRPRWTNAP